MKTFLLVLGALVLVLSTAPNASAWHASSGISVSGNYINGWVLNVRDAVDVDVDICVSDAWDDLSSQWYCAERDYFAFYVGVNGVTQDPNGNQYYGGWAARQDVAYLSWQTGPFPTGPYGVWSTIGVNYVAQAEYVMLCDSYTSCGAWVFWAFPWYFGSISPPQQANYQPSTPITLTITRADITSDQIVIFGSGGSGMLSVHVGGPNVDNVVYNNIFSGGQTTLSFMPNALRLGVYRQVNAYWYPNGGSASAGYALQFQVLGVYENTVYNTPNEQSCIGAPASAYITSIPNNQTQCNWTSDSTMKSDFIDQCWLNGSGYRTNGQSVVRESLCFQSTHNANQPGDAFGRSFRQDSIVPACARSFPNGSYYVGNDTIAIGPLIPAGPGVRDSFPQGILLPDGVTNLTCGHQVLIVGVGVKLVTDECPACAGQNAMHFDNYTTQPACAKGAIAGLGKHNAIVLNQ